MRALSIISASRAIVMLPSRNWRTNSLIRSLPRSRAAGSTPNRPSETIWSSRPTLAVCSVTCCEGCALCASAIGFLVLSHFRFELVQLLRIADSLKQQLFEFVVALQTAAEIREAGPQVEKVPLPSLLAPHLLRPPNFSLLLNYNPPSILRLLYNPPILLPA